MCDNISGSESIKDKFSFMIPLTQPQSCFKSRVSPACKAPHAVANLIQSNAGCHLFINVFL